MRLPLRPAASPLAALAAMALSLLAALAPAPAAAQGVAIDFGQAVGEDSLLGGTSDRAFGSVRQTGEPWHRAPAARAAYRYSTPSVTSYSRPPGSTYFRGTGIFANAQGRSYGWLSDGGSILVQRPSDAEARGPAGAKIIDVAHARLDRQPIGRSGMSVQHVGSAKIIRLAPGYGSRRDERREAASGRETIEEREMAALRGPAAPRPYTPPVPSAAPAPTPAPAAERTSSAPPATATGAFLEPWTDEWLRDCVARHQDFDASLGTYTGNDGRRRFCTGETG